MIPAKEKAAASGVPVNAELSPDMPLESFKDLIGPQESSSDPGHSQKTLGAEMHARSGEQAGEVAEHDRQKEAGTQRDGLQQNAAGHHQRSPAQKRSNAHAKSHQGMGRTGGSLTFPSLAVFENASGSG